MPQAYAGCSGTIPCGADETDCICSVGGGACSYSGQTCGGVGTCSCSTTCDETQNSLNCSSLSSQQLCNEQGDLSSCSAKCSVSRPDGDYCLWSGGGATATPVPTSATCGNGTCGSGESCSNCPADCGACGNDNCIVRGKIQKYDDLNLASATDVVSLWSSLATTIDSTDGSGNFGFSKNYDNVGPTIKVYVNNPYSPYRTFKVKDMPSGCSKEDNSVGTDTVIQCSKSVCLNQGTGLLFNFEEVAPTANRPNAEITNVTNLTYGQTLPWKVTVTDADGNAKSSGIYIHQGTPAVGVTSDWRTLKWTGDQNASSFVYQHSDPKGVTDWTCNADHQGTWTLVTEAVDTGGMKCTGNPVAG